MFVMVKTEKFRDIHRSVMLVIETECHGIFPFKV